MLNVLSFFFIDTEWGQRLVNDLFRCSMFWAFSLLSKEVWEQSSLLTLRFDAQCFELFLYDLVEYAEANGVLFRCSMFWAFSLCLTSWRTRSWSSMTFRCSMFWAFSLWLKSRNQVFSKPLFRCSMFWAFSL